MHALVSGQAGVAIFIQGNAASVVAAGSQGESAHYPLTSLPLLLAGATDVVEFPSISRKEALAKLALAASSDLALHLALIMLDGEEDQETRQMAAEDLDEALANEAVYDSLANRLCSIPLPASVDAEALCASTPSLERVGLLLDELVRVQPALRRYQQAWRELPCSAFPDPGSRHEYEALLIRGGVLRLLANAGEDRALFGRAQYECYQALAGRPGARQILAAWLRDFVPDKPNGLTRSPIPAPEAQEPTQEPQPALDHKHMPPQKSHETYQNVLSQKQAIVDAMRKGDLVRARKYTGQLVQFQMGHGGAGFAAKSLCYLAQEAKGVHAYSLQLELARWAARIAPSDGWACGQVADAYCCLQQYDEALKWFGEAAGLGQTVFASTGRARVLREQGLLHKALEECELACQQHPGDVSPLLHLADVQRELSFLDDALATYQEAMRRFPGEVRPRCARAAVLADLGRLEEALTAYDENLGQDPNDLVSHNGRAEVLREMGRLEEALQAYESVIECFPDDPVPRCGRAEVLKEMGRLDDALVAYEEATDRFGFQPIPWNGRAEVYKEMGRLDNALAAYDEAVERFPDDVRTLGGRANLLKLQGRLEDALQAYDQIVARFPFDGFAQQGRAHLLKQLGHLEEAVKAYDQAIQRVPHNQSALYAKAAVFVAMGRYSDAEAVLPTTTPRTRDEWVAYHIRGMILLKTERVEKAVEHFERGLATIPFARERRYYENALAVAEMHQERFRDAENRLGRDQEPLTDVIRLHVLGALDYRDQAREAYGRLAANCPRSLQALRDELAAHYSLRPVPPRFDSKWVFEQECRCILLEAA